MSVAEGVAEVPTVSVRIGSSTIAFETSGEILETTVYDDFGSPDWAFAGICDYRGTGGREGYEKLRDALIAAEYNARLCGYEVLRVPVPT